jgi:methylmalonyl-CoA mutase
MTQLNRQAEREAWRRLALAALHKARRAGEDVTTAGVEERLSTTTYDGITVAPLHLPDDAVPPSAVRAGRPVAELVESGWDVRQRHCDQDVTRLREAIAEDVAGGVTSLWLEVGGVALDPAALPDVLAGVRLDRTGVVLDAGGEAPKAATALLALADRAGTGRALTGNLGLDPLGVRARTGERLDARTVVRTAARCAADYPRLRALTVDATAYHDAGGSDAQELGCALATGVAYLRLLTEGGLSLDRAFGQLEFRYVATGDQFLTIAKLRSARRLWARVAQACGVPAPAQLQHAVTSRAMMTVRDPWTNLLRTTIAGLAAAVGGADAVTVQPFDVELGRPDAAARRTARNTHQLLRQEAQIGRVVDPAGGCWYVERLTEDLAGAAWAWFTEIERHGAMAAALDAGLVADRLARTWRRRSTNLRCRLDPIVGVSEFANLDERLPDRAPAYSAEVVAAPGGLPRRRYAEEFEARRRRADDHAAVAGTRPRVFLATLGPVAAHAARAGFARKLFAAGGIGTVDGPVGADPTAIAAEFAAAATGVACVCGTDRAYADGAAAVAAALKAAGARRVWLAGGPAGLAGGPAGLAGGPAGIAGGPAGVAGVDSYLFAGCDAVATIDATLADLGVAP